MMEYPIIKELYSQKDIPVIVQDTMGTKALKTGPNQYEAGYDGLYLPEKLGPKERIYLAENPLRGEWGTDYVRTRPDRPPVVINNSIQDVFRHEIFHPVSERFYKEWLGDTRNEKVNAINDKIAELRQEWSPSEYGQLDAYEWLSDTFSKYTHPEFPFKKDMPANVQKFMERLVNSAKMADIDLTGLGMLLTVGGAALVSAIINGDEETKSKLAGLSGLVAGVVGFGNKLPYNLEGVRLPRPRRFTQPTPEYSSALVQGEKGTSIHAGPHLFDEFDVYGNIGKGQGAAAFGEGLYSATDPSVQSSYFNEFINRSPAVVNGKPIPIPEKVARKIPKESTVGELIQSLQSAEDNVLRHHSFKRKMINHEGLDVTKNYVLSGISSGGRPAPYFVIREGGFAKPVFTSANNYKIAKGEYLSSFENLMNNNGIDPSPVVEMISKANRRGFDVPEQLIEFSKSIDDKVANLLNQLPTDRYYVDPNNITAIAVRRVRDGRLVWEPFAFHSEHITGGSLRTSFNTPQEALDNWRNRPRIAQRVPGEGQKKPLPPEHKQAIEKLKQFEEDAKVMHSTPQYRLKHAPEYTYLEYRKPISEQDPYVKERLNAVMRDLGIRNETSETVGGFRNVRELTGWEAYTKIANHLSNNVPNLTELAGVTNAEKAGRIITSQYLNSIGIGGIRFPSSGMRNEQLPNYVHFFDPDIIETNISKGVRKLHTR